MANVTVQLRSALRESDVRKVAAQRCQPQDHTILLDGNADVFKPDGEPLLLLRRGGIPADIRDKAYPSLHHLRTYKTTNRGVYGGEGPRITTKFADGVKSKNSHAAPAASAIIGYFDRQGGRHPHCRTTAFTASEVALWKELLPMIEGVDAMFKRELPSYHAAQLKAVRTTDPHWVIGGTAFSTLTVNNNAVAGIHQDKGDYKAGFGIISCHRMGNYTGGILCFPQYRVGVDLQDGDVLFFNAHDWHGMTPIEADGEYERITCVYYFREKMVDCGTPDEELRNAKLTRGKV